MAEFVATADGVRLAYDTAGRGEPPVVFVHGWGGDRSYFAPQVTHFADRHAVATLDLRGHGESGRPEPGRPGSYEVAAFADDTLAVAEAAGLHRPVVVGHSLGGLAALACAARPGAVRAAVMVNPALALGRPGAGAGAPAVDRFRRSRGRAARSLPPRHHRPDRRRRALQPARGARPGQCDDRTVPGGHRALALAAAAVRTRRDGPPAHDPFSGPAADRPTNRRRTQRQHARALKGMMAALMLERRTLRLLELGFGGRLDVRLLGGVQTLALP